MWREGNIVDPKSQTINNFIQVMSSNSKDKEYENIWVTLISHVWWQIWKQQNTRIFKSNITKRVRFAKLVFTRLTKIYYMEKNQKNGPLSSKKYLKLMKSNLGINYNLGKYR